MAKQRFKFQSSYDEKRNHMKVLKKIFGIRDISSEKNKFGEYFVYFTAKDDEALKKAEFELEKLEIEIQKV